jgi:hypothetical protein
MRWKKILIDFGLYADERALARIGDDVDASKTTGWPGDARSGIRQR